jgi:VWFA-related protein
MKRSFAFAVGLVAASAGVLFASQQIPVFRSETNYVEVSARVVDRNGKLVEGLTANDFEVREDNRKQRVEALFRVDLPTPWNNASMMRPVLYKPELSPDLQVANGRIYLLYLNAVESRDIVITRRLAKDFVNTYLMPDDVVALWQQGAGLMTFTNDKTRIHAAIDAFLGTNDVATKPIPGTKNVGRIEPTLNSALDWFSSVQGRKKSMLLFSAGWAGIGPVFSDSAPTVSTQTDLVDRADVQIYIVDTRGLTTYVPRMIGEAVASVKFSESSGPVPMDREMQAINDGVNDLRWLAEDAGGFAIVNENEYRDGFKRIVDENSQYYVLGYQSTAKKRPNWDYREITVKVTKPGLDGVRVQARKGYVAR